MNTSSLILLKKIFPVVNAYKHLQTFVRGFVAEIVGVEAGEDKGGINVPVRFTHTLYAMLKNNDCADN